MPRFAANAVASFLIISAALLAVALVSGGFGPVVKALPSVSGTGNQSPTHRVL